LGKPLATAAKNSDASSTPKKRAKRMSPEDRRQQILSCGIKVFAVKGISNATHADIATEADVAIPTVFHYFPTIDVLQQAILLEVKKFLLDGFVYSRMDVDMPAYARIEDMLLSFREAVDTQRDYVTIWLEWSGSTRGAIWELYTDFYKETTSAIRLLLMEGRADNSISESINGADAARVILAMAHAIAHMRFTGSSQRTVKHMVHELVLNYIAPSADEKDALIRI
jgi:TetR/AcrR family hemagglutinin/protease transcriptional regulator